MELSSYPEIIEICSGYTVDEDDEDEDLWGDGEGDEAKSPG